MRQQLRQRFLQHALERVRRIDHEHAAGRQPWAVGEVLPTHLAASALTAGQIWTSLALISALYTVFLVIEIWLMQHFARKGPSALHTGKYDLETGKAQGV